MRPLNWPTQSKICLFCLRLRLPLGMSCPVNWIASRSKRSSRKFATTEAFRFRANFCCAALPQPSGFLKAIVTGLRILYGQMDASIPSNHKHLAITCLAFKLNSKWTHPATLQDRPCRRMLASAWRNFQEPKCLVFDNIMICQILVANAKWYRVFTFIQIQFGGTR